MTRSPWVHGRAETLRSCLIAGSSMPVSSAHMRVFTVPLSGTG